MSAAGILDSLLSPLERAARLAAPPRVRYAVVWQSWRDTMVATAAFDDEAAARAERDRRQALELPEHEGGAVWKLLRIEELP